MNSTREKAIRIFQEHGGVLRTSEAIGLGISYETLYGLRDSGELEQLERGLYRLQNSDHENPDLIIASKKQPEGVICLISALSFHDITTQIPRRVDIAIKAKVWPTKIDHPPVEYYYFSPASHQAGVEEHHIDGVAVKVYSREKTIADCFKFRSRLGTDVCTEAIELYKEQQKPNISKIMEYARIDRVQNVIKPYLESLFN